MDFSMKTGDFYTVAIKMIQLTSQIRFIIKMYRLSASCEKKQLKQFDTTNASPQVFVVSNYLRCFCWISSSRTAKFDDKPAMFATGVESFYLQLYVLEKPF